MGILWAISSIFAQPYRISVSPNPPRQNQSAVVTVENLGTNAPAHLQLVYNLGNGQADVEIPSGVCSNGNKTCSSTFIVPPSFFMGIAAIENNAYVAYLATSPLSVSLKSASVHSSAEGTHLIWETATESQNGGFLIEHFKNDAWQKIGFVPSTGNGASTQSYIFELPALHPGYHQIRLSETSDDRGVRTLKTFDFLVESPNAFALSNAYPNPITYTSQIDLSIVRQQTVKIEVFNALGTHIATLHDGLLEANHVYSFPLAPLQNLPKGMYFLRARGAFFHATQKLILNF